MREQMFEEIMEYADGAETIEEIEEVIEDMEKRWRIRRIEWEDIEAVTNDFRNEIGIE